jgi:hypothetical protein
LGIKEWHVKREEWGIGEGDWQKVEAACKIEGCSVGDLLRAWVDGGQVVLIIRPGRKRFVDVPAEFLEVGEPPTDSAARGGPEPVTFEGFLSPRLFDVLEGAGLLDPDRLRGMSDEELRAVPGIGRRTVEVLREVLERYEEKRRQPELLGIRD